MPHAAAAAGAHGGGSQDRTAVLAAPAGKFKGDRAALRPAQSAYICPI